MSSPRRSLLAGAVLGSALLGSHLVACGSDAVDATPTPEAGTEAKPTPTVEAAADAGAEAEDAPPPPTTVSVHMNLRAGGEKTTNYVVFYPLKTPDKPVVEPIAAGETVTKTLPDGAHVVFAAAAVAGATIVQVDDVAAGETVELSEPPTLFPTGPALSVLRRVPPSAPADRHKRFWSCNAFAGVPDEEANNTPVPQTFARACLEPGGKARFLVTSHVAGGGDVFPAGAIGSAVVDVGDGGTPPLAAFTWTTPAPTTWTFSGSAPGAEPLALSAHAFFTQSTMAGAFPAFVPRQSVGGVEGDPRKLTFIRPPAGFNDGELHWVAVGFPPPVGEDVASAGMLVDRTGPSATLATDLGTMGPHFLNGRASGTAGSVDFAFQPSAVFPAGTVFLTTVLGSEAEGGASLSAWLTLTTRTAENRVRGLVLPDVVRTATKFDQLAWGEPSANITAVTGIEARELRTNPLSSITAFGLSAADELGDVGLPRRNFQAKVAHLIR